MCLRTAHARVSVCGIGQRWAHGPNDREAASSERGPASNAATQLWPLATGGPRRAGYARGRFASRTSCPSGLSVAGKGPSCPSGLSVVGKGPRCPSGLSVVGKGPSCPSGLSVVGKGPSCRSGLSVVGKGPGAPRPAPRRGSADRCGRRHCICTASTVPPTAPCRNGGFDHVRRRARRKPRNGHGHPRRAGGAQAPIDTTADATHRRSCDRCQDRRGDACSTDALVHHQPARARSWMVESAAPHDSVSVGCTFVHYNRDYGRPRTNTRAFFFYTYQPAACARAVCVTENAMIGASTFTLLGARLKVGVAWAAGQPAHRIGSVPGKTRTSWHPPLNPALLRRSFT